MPRRHWLVAVAVALLLAGVFVLAQRYAVTLVVEATVEGGDAAARGAFESSGTSRGSAAGSLLVGLGVTVFALALAPPATSAPKAFVALLLVSVSAFALWGGAMYVTLPQTPAPSATYAYQSHVLGSGRALADRVGWMVFAASSMGAAAWSFTRIVRPERRDDA